jgi:xanthine dehydrogenase YagR molybdenum-binding subunit
MQKVFTTVARYMPDAAHDPLSEAGGYIGRPMNRVDGPLKVTGGARFAAEYAPEGLVHAVLVCSTIARGRIATIDTTLAEAAPGVISVLTHRNAPRMKAPSLFDVTGQGQGCAPSDLPIMQDDSVRWNGQPVAVVIADTLEQAEFAATLVAVDYASEPARVSFEALKGDAIVPADVIGEPPEVRVGNAEAALTAAPVSVDTEYRTPWYNHNAIEPHATVALWTADDHLSVFDSTQAVGRFAATLGEVFGLKATDVDVIAPFVGGAFGG